MHYKVESEKAEDSALLDFKSKIEGVVERFAEEGLTADAYLKAAVKQPSLFAQSPDTIESNIRGVVQQFAEEGLTADAYLKAAVKQPSLFNQSPDTIAGHIRLMADLYRKERIAVNGSGTIDRSARQPLKPLLDFLVKNPVLLCLADDNFALRDVYSAVASAKPSSALLTRKRGEIEHDLSERLGRKDPKAPVEKISREEAGEQRWADNLLLRALIREGIIKGELGEGRGR